MQKSSAQCVLRIDPQHELQRMLQHAAARVVGPVIKVFVEQEHVRLTGRVSSWHEKQCAQEAVRTQALPRFIRNEISVA